MNKRSDVALLGGWLPTLAAWAGGGMFRGTSVLTLPSIVELPTTNMFYYAMEVGFRNRHISGEEEKNL